MKITMVSETYLPMVGGTEIHVSKLSRYLLKKDAQIDIITNTIEGEDFDGGIHIYRYRGGFSPLTIIANFLQIKKISRNADVIHSHYSNRLSFLAGIYSFFSKKPLIVTLHGFGTLNEHFPFLKRIFLDFIRWGSLKLSRKIISTSQEMFNLVSKFIPSAKLELIPNGVNTQEFSPFVDEDLKDKLKVKDKTIVMLIRRLIEKNGVQYLIEAAPDIIKRRDNVHFIIVGTGRLESYTKQRTKELNLENVITFVGRIENEQVKNYLSIADIVVFPSAAESSSIACLEAMSMGKAIIASRVGGYIDIIQDGFNGLFIELFDDSSSRYDAPLTLPEEKIRLLSDTIVKLIDNSELRRKLGDNARFFVLKEYDWGIITDKIFNIYNCCLKK